MTALVYIAGPLGEGPAAEVNTTTAMLTMHKMMDHGLAVICPHLSLFAHRLIERPYEEWMALNLELVRRSDHVYRIPGESPGADREVAHAVECAIPVWMPEFGGLDQFLDQFSAGVWQG